MQKQEKKQQQANGRMAMMADRMAIMLVTLKNRHGDDWEPFFGEHGWEDPDGFAAEMRGWAEYKTALDIVRLWIKRHDKRVRDELGND